ncbi:caspase-8-like isoform X1 [Odontomachus brunneus]|uniref:caspase-8-like isoform X1 n=1 Tax=Odontomachus brunneus TaxID=486640 RepID=UPI0013F18F8F|nr:caspase-8-like isoform X1 [Odontomachus brunneus]XP_032676855.1 caspase-8-like isoform X1 [Odontomachus brunneus]XP_032676856.1 caspase-8-like isoform X1 [Odontomachus brunneus]
MSLSVDASALDIDTVLNIDILRQIEDDLDIDEKISILFLIIEDYANIFRDVFKLFEKATKENTYIITDYVKQQSEKWKDRVLEALCILNNREVIKKLRLRFSELDLQYFPKIKLCSKNISNIAKCLYAVCESLDEVDQKLLLKLVKSENANYEHLLDNIDYLELHMLYWMEIEYITVSNDQHNMKKLLKHLKKFENLKTICMDLEKFGNHLHVVDTRGTLGINDKSNLQLISLEETSYIEKHCYIKKIRPINSGLCVIINQMYFSEEYEARFGTNADCINLSETFQAFGFKVYLLENLKKTEMLEKIKNIPSEHGINYDCLFLCILSHGYEGGIITSDEKEVPLEVIERTLCCMELRNIMKIVIIQACQGKVCGRAFVPKRGNNYLTADGICDFSIPASDDIRQYENFFMFMSTIQGFVSIRHKEEGSWFIQEVCKILKTYGSQLTFLECVREIMTSIRKKQGIIGGSQVAQLSEIRQDRLDSDFQLKNKVEKI